MILQHNSLKMARRISKLEVMDARYCECCRKLPAVVIDPLENSATKVLSQRSHLASYASLCIDRVISVKNVW